MPSPIRVSVELFESAKREASVMNRSLAGQIEYWAKIGEAVEAAGLGVDDIKELFYRGRVASEDPFARFVAGRSDVQEVPDSVLLKAKHVRQKIDYDAQKAGLVSSARMSPFADVRMSARIREVPLDE